MYVVAFLLKIVLDVTGIAVTLEIIKTTLRCSETKKVWGRLGHIRAKK